jgi:hypothetical protein
LGGVIMKKIIITVLIMVYLFVLGLINAEVHSMETSGGYMVTYVEIYGFRFNYWEEI